MAKPDGLSQDNSVIFKRFLLYAELPDWRRDNEYIHQYYVRDSLGILHVIKSLFYLHNESVNIYSHLIPAILSLVLGTPFSIFTAGVVVCLGCSATFHTCKSHSEAVSNFTNQLDYVGISVLIGTSMVAILRYSLDDQEQMRILFEKITAALGTICCVVSLIKKFRSPHWRPYRAAIFVAYGLTGVSPVIASISRFGVNETIRRSALPWLLLEAFCYIFGAFLYGVRFPEKFAPGKFDLWGHSHQLFHVLVVVAAWCHLKALFGARDYAYLRSLNSAL